MSRRRIWRWLWCLPVLVGAWLLGVALYIIQVGHRDQAAKSDAIIVLGAAAYDAKPSPVFEERIKHGIDLYRRGLAPKLIFTGGYGGVDARFSESQVGKRYAEKHDVPEGAILIETASRTTKQNLTEAAALMRDNGLHRAIVVSDPLHMARAMRLAREAGIDALGSPTPSTRFRGFGPRLRFLLQEMYFFHRDRILDAV